MACIPFAGGIVCVADAEDEIEVNGRLVRFEFSRYGGPIVLRRDGDVAKRQPGPRSAFWPAFDAWFKARPKGAR